MKTYTITVNGNVYEVTVEEGATGAVSAAAPKAAPKAAPAAAPAAAPKAAAPAAAGVRSRIRSYARQDPGCEGKRRTGCEEGRCDHGPGSHEDGK